MTTLALARADRRAELAAELSETFRLWWREWMRVLLRDGGPLIHDWPQSWWPPDRCESCGAVQRKRAAETARGGPRSCSHVGCS
jgi:hypothetical protein